MQTKSIHIGEEYAYPRRRHGQPDQLLRFKVRAIVTRKEGATQSYSKIEGWIVEDQPVDNEGHRKFNSDDVKQCDPEALLGPFQEHKELFDRRQAEITEREAKEKAHVEACAKLVELLYQKTGVERPEVVHDTWKVPFRDSRATITIGRDGVLPLIAILEKL